MPFTILKGLPDYEAYLVVLIDKGILAQLPKKYAMRNYKIGETGWASVFNIQGARVTLSQKSTQYVRKIMEHIHFPLIQDGMIKVKRVAKKAGGSFYKVAVESLLEMSGSELLNEVKPYLEETREYLNEKVIIVKYSRDVKEYIANSLVPAPAEKIKQIMIFENMKLADVKVSEEYVGKFLGPKAMNVLTAAKLTGYKIEITGV